MIHSLSSRLPILILDSNAVFDWLIFKDPNLTRAAEAITSGKCTWIATRAMLDEADDVVARGTFDALLTRDETRRDTLRIMRNTWVQVVDDELATQPDRARSAGDTRLVCADPDDQKFIDLAMRTAPAVLLTRDKALLDLAKPAALSGVVVARPADWQGEYVSGPVFRDNLTSEP